MEPLLEVKNLCAYFFMRSGTLKAVDGVSFEIQPGEIVGLAGESGCGKTTAVKCVLRLLPPPGRIVEGEIYFDDKDLLSLSPEEMRQVRGKHISIVLQDAMAALNPVITVGEQVADVLLAHTTDSDKTAWEKAVELLGQMGIPRAKERARYYAHEFSGGMQQRVVISTALACNPALIIADEPTTGLDVTIQLQILSLLLKAREQMGSAILYISHDLATVVSICDRIMIMYAGEIVESAPTVEILTNQIHPYTQGLIGSIPPLGGTPLEFLPAIPGLPPNPVDLPPGCRFAPRCSYANDECLAQRPELVEFVPRHYVRCFPDKEDMR
jgi:oligopeptide/dipeptide ABC transporter ATP-binding protein